MRLNGLGRELVLAAALAKVVRQNIMEDGLALLAEELDYHLTEACFQWTKQCGAGSNEIVAEVQNTVEKIHHRKKDH